MIRIEGWWQMLSGQIGIPALLFLAGASFSGTFIAFGLLASLLTKLTSDPKVNRHILRQKLIMIFVAGVWLEILAIGIKIIWG